jgi:hypothetical protein
MIIAILPTDQTARIARPEVSLTLVRPTVALL